MRESEQTIKEWMNKKKAEGADFLFVVCDTFDYEQYPVGVTVDKFWDRYDHFNGQNMQRIEGVYDLKTMAATAQYPAKPAPVQPTSPERTALEEVRQALLDPKNEHLASRANRALGIIDKVLGEQK